LSPLKEEHFEQIRTKRIKQIKKASVKIFAMYGFDGAKMNLIAEEAGVSQGLFYRYFESKDELFILLVKELLELASGQLQVIHQLPGTPYEQIKALTEQMLDESSKYPFMFIQQVRTMKRAPDEVKELIEKHSPNALVDLLIPIFMKGQEMGEFRKGNPRQLLSWYLHIVNSLIISDHSYQEYGLPDVDILMRILK